MSIPSYLLFILFTAQIAYGYTVVLTSGKRIEGTLIREDETSLSIKDSKGVSISFRKSILDLSAMSLANSDDQTLSRSNGSPKRKPLSIVELATETKKQRTGKAKMIDINSLNETAAFSVMGTDQEPQPERLHSKSAASEKDWQSRLWSLKKEVNRLTEKYVAAEISCEEAREKQFASRTTPSSKPVELMSTYKESPRCRMMTEVENQLREAERRLELTREEARRAGVSWQSLE